MRSEPHRSRRDLVSRGNALDYVAAAANRGWYRARAYARPLVRWRVPVARITGTVAGTTHEGTIVVAGWKRTVAYYASRFFETMSEPVTIANVPVLRLPTVLKAAREDCDLVVARVPGPGSHQLFDDFYLHVPEAVDARLEVPADSSALALASTRARRNVGRVRDNGLTWTVSTDEADFPSFYHDFYVPFLRTRYGDLAHEVDRATLLRAYRRGCILWVHKDGRRVAGALFQPHGPVLGWLVMGALTEGEDAAKIGALSAIYLFGAECAAQHGFRWLDLGFSKASPRDGVLSHKASWGARVYCPWKVDHDLLVGWRTLSDDVANFLNDTPLIFREGPALSAVTALSADDRIRAADPIAVGQKIAMHGLSNVYVTGVPAGRVHSSQGKVGTVVHAVPAGSSMEFRRIARQMSASGFPAISAGDTQAVERLSQAGQTS
jgi:hypothetical protein